MVCIYCDSTRTQVTNSRLKAHAKQVWRRRSCSVCQNTFTTRETPDLTLGVRVQTASGNLKPFFRDVLFLSIYESCKHRSDARTVSSALTDTVLAKLLKHAADGLIHRDDIVRQTIDTLNHYDTTACAVYEAYHGPSASA